MTGGGYEDPVKIVSRFGRDTVYLKSTHEEADTRILLHAADASRFINFIKVHQIQLPNEIVDSLLALHAITGSDAISQFAGIGKRSA